MESVNRSIYNFNKALDNAVLKPVAETYNRSMPKQINVGISNFFSNLGEIRVFANNLLQLKPKQATQDAGRFLLNTTVGFLGFFDPASEYGLPKHDEDFGQTLGYWGVGSGPYVVLPLFGPSTLRDAPAMLVDKVADPTQYNDQAVLYGGSAIKIIDQRADILSAEKVLDAATMDEYVFLREAYLQRRDNQVNDGQTQSVISDDELFNDK